MLFSEYFLEVGIKKTIDWKNCSENEVQNFYNKIYQFYKSFNEFKSPDESDTEKYLIEKIIEELGFSFTRQKLLEKRKRENIPDFILFANEQDKKNFDREDKKNKPWHLGICILEAKKWKRNLDKSDKTDSCDPHIPSNQILKYLSIAEIISKNSIQWGILTNGTIWRLYYQKHPIRSECYLEFDIEKLLQDNFNKSFEKIKTFYLLFRKQAFIKTDWRNESFLQIALNEDKRWKEKISENLKDKLFSDIFINLATGFLENYLEKNLNQKIVDDKILNKIYENTLIFLYRVLFLFYAEDRNLLPINNDNYKIYSVTKIREDIHTFTDKNNIPSKNSNQFYSRLSFLFKIINIGDESLGISPYNGGLFNDKKHEFLDKYSISDYFLITALEKLSRDHDDKLKPTRINYRDLSIEQLGSIYEGLLEFKLKIAENDMKILDKKYVFATDNKNINVKNGSLYLTNDKFERKSSGTYYTPDYIVRFIVKNTIEPLIQQKINDFEIWQKEINNLHNKTQLNDFITQNNLKISISANDYEIEKIKQELLKIKDPLENILKIKILDPAIGSGHFLVATVDYLSDRILEMSNEFETTDYTSPLFKKLESIKKQIIEQNIKKTNKVDKDFEAQLSNKNLIKRIILKKCIYGVDLNPLAVELAKVSLWLHTFTVGAPLSFLDHHIKIGNSLIGANPDDYNKILDKYPLFTKEMRDFIEKEIRGIREIEEIVDADLSEIEHCFRKFTEINEIIKPCRMLLDIYLSDKFFELKNKKLKIKSPIILIDGTQGNPIDIVLQNIKLNNDELELIDKYLNFARNKKFFHWKLEFPEIWYDNFADTGFDVIIGNPPYIDSEKMTQTMKDERKFIKKTYNNISGNWDIYCAFLEQAVNLCKEGGYIGMIIPNKLLASKYALEIRKLIKEFNLKIIRDYSTIKVFGDANVYPIVLIFQKRNYIPDNEIQISSIKNQHEIDYEYTIKNKEIQEMFNLTSWSFLLSKERQKLFGILNGILKRKENFKKIGEIAIVKDATHVKNAYEIQILENCFVDEKHKKFLISGLINQYENLWGLKKISYIKNKYTCPVVNIDYLKNISEKYYDETLKKKIIISGLSKYIEAFCDDNGEYVAGKSTIIVIPNDDSKIDIYFLTCCLNSNTLNFIYNELYSAESLQGGYINFTPDNIAELPVPFFDGIEKTENYKTLSELSKSVHDLTSQKNDEIRKFFKWLNITFSKEGDYSFFQPSWFSLKFKDFIEKIKKKYNLTIITPTVLNEIDKYYNDINKIINDINQKIEKTKILVERFYSD